MFATIILAAFMARWLVIEEPAGGTVVCDKYSAVDGSNGAEGTRSEPFRTTQKLVDSLRPGQTGCLRAGTYAEGDEQLAVSRGGAGPESRITVQNYPGEEAIIRAQVKVNPGADFVTFRSAPGERWSLVLDGTGGPVNRNRTNQGRHATSPSPLIHSNDTEWVDLDITKRSQGLSSAELYRTGVCVLIGVSNVAVSGTSIEGNRIHGCGVARDQEDESYLADYFGPGEDLDNRASGGPDNHGVYVSTTSGTTTIRDNLIYANGERGVQLYPDANGVLVEGNVIDGNGEGIVFSGSSSEVSSDNTVRNNVISNSRVGWNVFGSWNQTRKMGTNNVVHDNCVWASNGRPNGGISPEEYGFDAYDNLIAEPAYVDPKVDNNFELGADSRCRAILDR